MVVREAEDGHVAPEVRVFDSSEGRVACASFAREVSDGPGHPPVLGCPVDGEAVFGRIGARPSSERVTCLGGAWEFHERLEGGDEQVVWKKRGVRMDGGHVSMVPWARRDSEDVLPVQGWKLAVEKVAP